MKRKYLFWGLGLVLAAVLCLGGWQYYKTQRIRNIFDEIYYEEADYHQLLFPKNRVFDQIEGLHFVDDSSEDFYSHQIDYNTDRLPNSLTSLGYSFDFRDNNYASIEIEMRLKLTNTETTINVDYDYHIKTKNVKRFIWFNSDNPPRTFSEKGVEKFLSEHGTSVAAIRKEADRIMKTKLLKDWVTIYPSRFTPEDWGDVRLVDVWKEDEE